MKKIFLLMLCVGCMAFHCDGKPHRPYDKTNCDTIAKIVERNIVVPHLEMAVYYERGSIMSDNVINVNRAACVQSMRKILGDSIMADAFTSFKWLSINVSCTFDSHVITDISVAYNDQVFFDAFMENIECILFDLLNSHTLVAEVGYRKEAFVDYTIKPNRLNIRFAVPDGMSARFSMISASDFFKELSEQYQDNTDILILHPGMDLYNNPDRYHIKPPEYHGCIVN